jgi:hypothetical protein
LQAPAHRYSGFVIIISVSWYSTADSTHPFQGGNLLPYNH